MLQHRVIRHQFRQGGLNHLAVCYDNTDDGHDYHLVHGPTFCGKTIQIGSGGWGYGPKNCPSCWAKGAPAERIR